MRGWFSNSQKHSLASRGISTTFELNRNWKGDSYKGERLMDVIFPEETEPRIIDYSKTLNIYENNEMVGRVVFMSLSNETVVYIYDMAIWNEYQGSGYGRELYYKLENSLPDSVKTVYAHSVFEATGFWESVGFENTKIQNYRGLTWMKKEINQ